jgi:hypothetical protein
MRSRGWSCCRGPRGSPRLRPRRSPAARRSRRGRRRCSSRGQPSMRPRRSGCCCFHAAAGANGARRRACSVRSRVQLAAIDPAGSPAAVEIVAACADGFALRPQPGAPDLAAGRYRGALVIEGTALPFEIELRPPSGERPRGGPVRWDDPAARARFDLALHQLVIGRLATADRGDRGGILGPAVAALDLSAAAGALRRYCTPLAPRARGSVEASGGRPRN